MRQMIYHVPYPIVQTSQAATALRPRKMRDAFLQAGYRVCEISGYAAQRRRRMRALAQMLERGERFDFCYSESATMATPLTEPSHLPPHPFLDHTFFVSLRRAGIPVGLYYRDIYWRYPSYVESLGPALATAMRGVYLWDLAWYRLGLDRLYLQSEAMSAEVPWVPAERHGVLSPGADIVDTPLPGDGPLRLFYVGALGEYYRLDTLVEAVRGLEGVELTLCTRPEIWRAHEDHYRPLMDSSIRVVHGSGPELEPYYAECSVASLVVEPSAYRDFVLPVKLFEYLGHGRPVLATANTLVGSYVSDNGVGWAVPYTREGLRAALVELRDHPETVREVTRRCRDFRVEHTWRARALQVAADLTGMAAPGRRPS